MDLYVVSFGVVDISLVSRDKVMNSEEKAFLRIGTVTFACNEVVCSTKWNIKHPEANLSWELTEWAYAIVGVV